MPPNSSLTLATPNFCHLRYVAYKGNIGRKNLTLVNITSSQIKTKRERDSNQFTVASVSFNHYINFAGLYLE